jgi:aspartokinase-like uncharacterized kinase
MVEPTVVKVGGSLLAWPGLRDRLTAWLDAQASRAVVLVPGGGAGADVVRALDRTHSLGDEAAHWLAVRAMGLNAHVLAALLPRARVLTCPAELPAAWADGVVPVLDCLPLLLEDEARPGRLPHSWAVTSDAIAARVAVLLGAQRLVLLKSVTVPPGTDWQTAARQGLVDDVFPLIVAQARMEVTAVNLHDFASACNGHSW